MGFAGRERVSTFEDGDHALAACGTDRNQAATSAFLRQHFGLID
jgi:hypothetical protein